MASAEWGRETDVPEVLALLPHAGLSPKTFEREVMTRLAEAIPAEIGADVRWRQKRTGQDGVYELDGTIQFTVAGLEYLTLVEAKLHKDPIKRDIVQVLYSRMQSLGAQKGIVIATSTFQRGAITFAKAHGVALLRIAGRKSSYIARSPSPHGPGCSWIMCQVTNAGTVHVTDVSSTLWSTCLSQ